MAIQHRVSKSEFASIDIGVFSEILKLVGASTKNESAVEFSLASLEDADQQRCYGGVSTDTPTSHEGSTSGPNIALLSSGEAKPSENASSIAISASLASARSPARVGSADESWNDDEYRQLVQQAWYEGLKNLNRSRLG